MYKQPQMLENITKSHAQLERFYETLVRARAATSHRYALSCKNDQTPQA